MLDGPGFPCFVVLCDERVENTRTMRYHTELGNAKGKPGKGTDSLPEKESRCNLLQGERDRSGDIYSYALRLPGLVCTNISCCRK